MDFFEKLESNPYEDLTWNIPEKKQGSVNIIGGNAGHFRTEIKTAEFIAGNFPIEDVRLVLPDALKGKIPEMPNFYFLPSVDSGGFSESQELIDSFNKADFNLVIGDLSKNKVTGKAIQSAVKNSEKMALITRDAVDLLTDNTPEKWMMNENIRIMASMAQLMKLLRAVYYPKMILMSSSLVQVADVLHKFTLSYPVGIVTLHNGQVLVAENGTVKAIDLARTGYTALSFWNGELAGKIVGMNLYNPSKFIEASVGAVMGSTKI